MQLLPQTPTPPGLLDARTVENVVIGLVLIAISTAAFFLLKPLFLALARRVEGRAADPALHGEVEQLRDQLAELEPLRGRLQELEERVEFAERLLAQRRDQELLPREGPR
jgi:Tfp pilus assembly protein PilO